MSILNSRLNPIASDNQNCYECYAQLLIYPSEIHPHKVSEALNLEATKINVIGDTLSNSLGKVREIKVAGWFLSSVYHVKSKDLRENLNWLLEKVNPVENDLKKITMH
jgi:D-mannonate dehydratase